MTSTIRPEIIDLTLSSFQKRLLYQFKRKRLIINIDPIGDTQYSQNDVLKVCEKYFEEIEYNTPSSPSFPKAVHWCWSQTKRDYILHLEDDWLLKKRVKVEKLKKYFDNEYISYVRLNLSSNNKFHCDSDYCYTSLSLNPSFFRLRLVKKLLNNFDIEKDPEKQFGKIWKDSNTYGKLILFGNVSDGHYVTDIGKKWRKYHNFTKPNISKSKSKSWIDTNESNALKTMYYKLKYQFFMTYWKIIAS